MSKFLLGMLFIISTQAGAHGEDRPGPHGGVITMPGPFHIELVSKGKNQIQAYLLDMEWKNPSIKDSSIELSQGTTQAKCTKQENHFLCDFPKSVNLTNKGELKAKAVREKQNGNTVNYALPLKSASHNSHH